MLLTRIPEDDPKVLGPPVLPLHARVLISGAPYRLVEITGRQMVFRRHDRTHTVVASWNQYCVLWAMKDLQVEKREIKAINKVRLCSIPYEFFNPTTRDYIDRKLYYCEALDKALLAGETARMAGLNGLPKDAVRCLSKKDVADWLANFTPFESKDVEPPEGEDVKPPEAQGVKPSRGTVMRDYALWKASGCNRSVLAHGNTGAARKSIFGEIVVDIIYDVLETYWAPNPTLSLSNVQTKIAEEIAERVAAGELETDEIPSIATIARYRKRLNNYLLVQLQEGTYEADQQHQPRGKILVPDFPHSRWEIDHSLLPVKVAIEFKDEHGNLRRLVVAQVWITVVIDAATRWVCAFELGIDGPSSLRTMRTLRKAIMPKFEIFAEHGIENGLDICMLPVTLVMDNGKDFHSKDVSALLSDLSITQVFAGVYRGDHKPFVERFFRTLKAFLRKIRGSQPKGPQKKGPKRRDEAPPVPLTLKQLERVIWKFIMDTYHIRPHAGLRRESPFGAMTSGLRRLDAERSRGFAPPLRFFSDYSALEMDLMFSVRRTLTVHKNVGVRFENLFYNSGALQEAVVGDAPSRFNPENLGSALIYSKNANDWLRVDCTDQFYANGLSLPVHRKVWARVKHHEERLAEEQKRKPASRIKPFAANEHALLREVFNLTGEAKPSTRSLRDGAVLLGRNMDMAMAVARADAIDMYHGRIPPGQDALIDLEIGDGGVWEIQPKEISAAEKRSDYVYASVPSVEDDDGDLTVDPGANFDPEATA
jgi:transposase InsO family protein